MESVTTLSQTLLFLTKNGLFGNLSEPDTKLSGFNIRSDTRKSARLLKLVARSYFDMVSA